MFKKLVTVLLVIFVINLAGVRLAYAESKEEKEARFAEKINHHFHHPLVHNWTRQRLTTRVP